MIIVIITGVLTFAVGLLIMRPLAAGGHRPPDRAATAGDTRRRELLRQLRDLDDDLADGKLAEDDHARLRAPVAREAAALLSRTESAASEAAAATTAAGRADTSPSGSPRGGRRMAVLLTLAGAGAAAAITVLLVSTVSSRAPGQTITGDQVSGSPASPGAAAGPGAAPGSGGGAAAAGPGAGQAGGDPAVSASPKAPTRAELAAVAAAESQVKQHPGDVTAHLALAGAYAAAGSTQLAAVEYLAVTQIDPQNAEANTSLALLAFEVGRPAQGKAMVDRVLAASPHYPEALYVRGLINLMGLRRARPAERDFSAYLAAAPFGSHRAAAATLLALAESQARR